MRRIRTWVRVNSSEAIIAVMVAYAVQSLTSDVSESNSCGLILSLSSRTDTMNMARAERV